ncbi:MBL fold metallo-hydrolase [Algivirga pacifica]|uniref:MBL fold metallo-hydrolase n=1 Tax=Algivirga pacifica TaxID=1162670 RepID=A0ABP9DL51_9BACT
MKVTFLGTGTSQGVPIITCSCEVCTSVDYRDKRLRTSIHIETDDHQSIVIDTGPDFRQQMLQAHIKQLDAVVFTHPHKDHTAGLDDIRAFYFAQGMQPMPVYCNQLVEKQLRSEFNYFFEEHKYPGVPSVDLHEIQANQPFKIGETLFQPIEVIHGKMPVLGFRINDFTYITDANYIAPEQKEKIKGSKVLVLNALRHEPHYSHFTLKEALGIIEEVQPEKAYLTHISHGLGLHKEVSQMLPENVYLAYDGLKI